MHMGLERASSSNPLPPNLKPPPPPPLSPSIKYTPPPPIYCNITIMGGCIIGGVGEGINRKERYALYSFQQFTRFAMLGPDSENTRKDGDDLLHRSQVGGT